MELNIKRRLSVFVISAALTGGAILATGGTAFAAGIDNASPSGAGNVHNASIDNSNSGDKSKTEKPGQKSASSGEAEAKPAQKSAASGSNQDKPVGWNLIPNHAA
ncbi:MAG: hypothetical protein ACRDR6_14025 [Pseudonocardiaceae bacterium]